MMFFTPTVNIWWIKHHLSNLEIPRETSDWVMKLKYAPYTARSVASCFQPLNVFCFLILPLKCHPCSEATWVIFNFVCISYSLARSRCVFACAVCFCAYVCACQFYMYVFWVQILHMSPVLLGPDVDLHWSTALNVLSLFFFFVASWPLSLSCMCGCTIFCMCIYDHSVNHGKSTITLYSDSLKTNMVFVAQLNDNFSLVRTNELLK